MAHEKQLAQEQNAEDKEAQPKKRQYQKELVSLLEDGYLDDLDPSLLYEENKDTTLRDGLKSVQKMIRKKLK